MTRTVTLGWKTLGLFALALLAAGGLIGTLAMGVGRATDAPGATPEVRVFAEPQPDGRIEVGVQQRELDGEWGRVQEPSLRFIPTNAEVGQRLYSSPVTLSIDDGRETVRLQFLENIYSFGQSTAAFLNRFSEGEEAVLCVNLDLRNEGRGRYCDGIASEYPGTVNRLDWDDPETLGAEIRRRIELGDAPGGMAASSYPAVIIAGGVLRDLQLRQPLTYYGTLIEPVPSAPDNLYCLIHHGSDEFWRLSLEAASRASLHYDIAIQGYFITDAEDHSAAIRDCVANGATALTTTLGDPEGVREAVSEAIEAGVRVVSFNSGADSAAELGSAVHIAVDERAIGREAGDAYNEHEISGDILCVIHEAGNIGLDERCEGLESAYTGGSVEVFPIYEAADSAGAVQLIGARLAEGDEVGGVFTLSSGGAEIAAEAIARAGSGAQLATVGFSGFVYEWALRGGILFVIWDQPILQTYLSVASMLLSDQLQINPAGWFGGPRLLIEPRVFEQEDIGQLLERLIGPSR